MAFREVLVTQVREALRAWLAGAGKRPAARRAGVDVKTAARYIRAAQAARLARDGDESQLSDDAITGWVKDGLTLVKMHEFLERSGTMVPYRDRPVTAAISRAAAIRDDALAAISRLGAQLSAALDQLAALGAQLAAAGDPEAAEAQAEAVRAATTAQIEQARAETASQAVARHAAELEAAEARAAAAQTITAMQAEAAARQHAGQQADDAGRALDGERRGGGSPDRRSGGGPHRGPRRTRASPLASAARTPTRSAGATVSR
jgi:hypothetical protein